MTTSANGIDGVEIQEAHYARDANLNINLRKKENIKLKQENDVLKEILRGYITQVKPDNNTKEHKPIKKKEETIKKKKKLISYDELDIKMVEYVEKHGLQKIASEEYIEPEAEPPSKDRITDITEDESIDLY